MSWMSRLAAFFGHVARDAPPVPPPPEPPLVRLQLPPVDASDLMPRAGDLAPSQIDGLQAWQQRPAEELAADLTCTIGYVDARGEESVRRISVRKVLKRDGRTYLVSYCYERNGIRSFLLDRVQECWDCESGEVIELAGWIAGLTPALPAPAQPKRPHGRPKKIAEEPVEPLEPERTLDADGHRRILERCGEGIRVLRFLSFCDGTAVEAEARVIREFALHACEGGVVDMEPIWCDAAFVTATAKRMRPSHDSFVKAAGAVAAQGQPMAVWVARCALDLIKADGAVHHVEQAHAAELANLLDWT